jgi:membrane-associated phospholipid phosphatase
MLGGRRALREGITALCLGMALTYVGYSLVPVAGPVMTMHFQVSLDLYYIKEVKEMLMDRSRIRYDCFPSFHTAGSLIMVWLCWRHARRVFWLTVPMAASTPLACVYLRYHYVTDVIAGVVLFVAVAYVVPRWLRRDDALTTPAVS